MASAPRRSRRSLVAVAAVAGRGILVGAGRGAARRPRTGGDDPDLAELRRALRRTGRPLEGRDDAGRARDALRGFDAGAAGYLRALRARRYGFAANGPTRGQRRGLRRALAQGLGATGRLRALWALPPRRGRSTVAYTEVTWSPSTTCIRRGIALLEAGDHHAAAVPLARARDLEPEKTSIREALGRALFHSAATRRPAAEFEAVVDRAPTNDYALFCLGRSLQQLGRHAEARAPARARRVHAPRARRTTGCTASAPLWRRPSRLTSQQPARRIVSRA